ncbi:MAG: penicillin-insensitive murein endopeptidase [Proteobacteria bacterium]|nr:penicillin-insensitive murein endopeptidase [Pseudomonadota bacterium]
MTPKLRTDRVLPRVALAAGLVACAAARISSADPPAEPAPPRSASIGAPMDGSLAGGAVLPKRGAGFQVMQKTLARRARFGTDELVRLVEEAAASVRRKDRGALLAVADLSQRRGGTLEHHGSHQSGRDVDFAFYMRDATGAPAVPADFVAFDRNGFSVDPPMAFRFDAARNWALVAALLSSKRAEVQWIFVSEHLKRILLLHADASGAAPMLVARARRALRQPGAKSHWDHFHVRIRCPADSGESCRDWAR